MAQVFISYSRKDKEFAQKLVAALVAEKREVWLDETNIEPTDDWLKEIFSNIEAADNFIFVISPDSVVSSFARKEIDHAVLNSKRIVPILYHNVPDKEVPEAVARFQRLDFTRTDHFDAEFAKLVVALDTDLHWKRAHTRLLTRAKEWERERKDTSFLLRGRDLREAEQWVTRGAEISPKLINLQSRYLLASRQWAIKLQRVISVSIALGFLIATGIAIYAFTQRNIAQHKTNEANEKGRAAVQAAEGEKLARKAAEDNAAKSKKEAAWALARQMIANAVVNLERDPEMSVLLAATAVETTWPWDHQVLPEAEDALHRAIANSHVRLSLRGHRDAILSMAWSPDGKRLATGSSDHTVKIWDSSTGTQLLTLRGHDYAVRSVAWSPDGKRLATAADRVRILNAANGKALVTLGSHGAASVAWSPDGKRLAAADFDRKVKVWDVASGKELVSADLPNDFIFSVAWSPDGGKLAVGCRDSTARILAADDGREQEELRVGKPVLVVGWSPNGKLLATGSGDAVRVWNAATGKKLLTLSGDRYSFDIALGNEEMVDGLAWSPDNKLLAASSANQELMVWNAETGKTVLTLSGHTRDIKAVAWSPDGRWVATGGEDYEGKVWDTKESMEVASMVGDTDCYTLAWDPTGTLLATGGRSGVNLWDAATGAHLRDLNKDETVWTVVWSHDGKRLATGSLEGAKVWDANTGKQLFAASDHWDDVERIAWSPEDHRLVAVDYKAAHVWDIVKGRELFIRSTNVNYRRTGAAWSSDGRRLVSVIGDEVDVWAAETGKKLLTLSGHRGFVRDVAWSPDGGRLATGSEDYTTKLWDVTTGKELLTLRGHSGAVSTVAWSPDGKLLATVAGDQIKIWDSVTGQELLTLGSQGHRVWDVAWSPDGKKLGAAGDYKVLGINNSNVHVYSMDIRELMNIARRYITTHPSDTGCKKYLQLDECPVFPTLTSR